MVRTNAPRKADCQLEQLWDSTIHRWICKKKFGFVKKWRWICNRDIIKCARERREKRESVLERKRESE